MPRYPLDFVQCPRCTHVWNRAFAYADIPYAEQPNHMFNRGLLWRGHLVATRDLLLARLPQTPTVVDIGCGEGHFVRGLAASGRRIAIRGGTGKAAAFMHHYGVDAERFPLVVDSDPDKVGTHVPGTGQAIRFRDALKTDPVEILVIPPPWRARDILAKMARAGIQVSQVLIEHGGRLVDYHDDPHPYR
jgi:hypothetical protein